MVLIDTPKILILEILENSSDPGWTRTNDPQLRRLLLYPAELRDQ